MDRSWLGSRPAVVAIDLHRGHLDPTVATLPVPAETAERVIDANAFFLSSCRSLGIPVIHVVTVYRNADEILANPFWRRKNEDPNATRKNIARHNLETSPGTEIIPSLYAPGDLVVDTKKRYDPFEATDLKFLLDTLGVDTLLLTGVNTNSCLLTAAIRGCNLDYHVVMVEDCVDTMDGPELHEAALLVLNTAFGVSAEASRVLEALRALQSEAGSRVGEAG